MRKIVTIELRGHLYQLDEQGYDRLRVYLEHAAARLGTDPDKAEIIRDLEQSIGEKLLRYLGPEKHVIDAGEVDTILEEIGPVHAAEAGVDAGAPATGGATASTGTGEPSPARRLYLIKQGAMISGLCNGIAAYLQVDPTFVRIAFIGLGVLEIASFDRPPALMVVLYLTLTFVVPYAKPSANVSAASGRREPFAEKVQRLVERVKAAFIGLPHNTPG